MEIDRKELESMLKDINSIKEKLESLLEVNNEEESNKSGLDKLCDELVRSGISFETELDENLVRKCVYIPKRVAPICMVTCEYHYEYGNGKPGLISENYIRFLKMDPFNRRPIGDIFRITWDEAFRKIFHTTIIGRKNDET